MEAERRLQKVAYRVLKLAGTADRCWWKRERPTVLDSLLPWPHIIQSGEVCRGFSPCIFLFLDNCFPISEDYNRCAMRVYSGVGQ
jgi:hypothetical protein